MLTGADVCDRSAGWRADRIYAEAILRPKTTAEVSKVMEICHQCGQSIVCHGGLTGLVQGAVTTKADVVLSLERMTRIEQLDETGRTMTVQAGATLQSVQQAATEAGLMFPLDIAARGSCTIGGNVATNAGGNRVIRYGMTRDLVLGLEAVLADGTVISSLNKMVKNNAGYDLKHLFIGTEGTLGIVTRAVLRLREQPPYQGTALVAADSFDNLTSFLRFTDRKLGGSLSAFEVMWQDYYELVATKQSSRPPLSLGYRFYILVETLAQSGAHFESVLEKAVSDQLIADAVVAKSKREIEALWKVRDESELIERVFAPTLTFDVSLGVQDMNDYVEMVQQRLRSQWSQSKCFTFGHLGDGNLHFMIWVNADDAETRQMVEEIVYQPLTAIHGSVSAEHGVGLEKKPYLHWCRNENEIALMRLLKRSMDPKGILNPGKVLDVVV